MTEEKIKKGVELLERLKKLNEEKKLWGERMYSSEFKYI